MNIYPFLLQTGAYCTYCSVPGFFLLKNILGILFTEVHRGFPHSTILNYWLVPQCTDLP